ncbi:MAG TPA: ATP-binding protein [Kofleriaceae bacterium]|nr:ATP-binding protein [Kofleriaceae bacterium]
MTAARRRPDELFAEMQARTQRSTHRTFVWLFLVQWAIAIAIAALTSPWTWAGSSRSVHPHVWISIGMGGVLCSLPLLLIRLHPTWVVTRHLVAAAQMLWSALFIMLMGGRIEAHFHVFGSLAFLAFYRDWRVIVTATLTLTIDHLLRGVLWPDSVYGVANPAWWRFLEHAAWVAFEDAILIVSTTRAVLDMRDAAHREAVLEQTTTVIRQKVEDRTRQLRETVERYRLLVESTEAIPFEYEASERRLAYIAPQAAKLLDCELADLQARDFMSAIGHTADRPRVYAAVDAFLRGERSPREPIDHRLISKHGRVINVRIFLSNCTGTRIRGIMLDVTHQIQLETELRQAQKLESVGRLAAGVAHELNTPIQFVSDSVEFVRAAIGDLVGVVEAQREALDAALAGTLSPPLAAQTDAAIANADLPYLVEQLPRALDRALDGTRRVATIVQSMRAFAHERRERSELDLREAIESTLTIARSEYKYVADVELALEPVPRVACYASEINQVILNVVINAAHAIADAVAGSDRRGKITIALRQVGDQAVISIGDTGTGIADDVRDHVFEMFFTTKPVGKGTGQGLALARSVIVDKHHGTLTFDTEVGVGTTFHVAIPIVPPARETEGADPAAA